MGVNRSLGLAFSKHFHQRIAVSPSAALTLFPMLSFFGDNDYISILGSGANTFELGALERTAVDFFVMRDVSCGKGCQ